MVDLDIRDVGNNKPSAVKYKDNLNVMLSLGACVLSVLVLKKIQVVSELDLTTKPFCVKISAYVVS